MRLHAEGAARQPQHEMAVDLRRAVRRDHDAMLLGERGDAQGLGKAGGPRRVELHIADAALHDKIAHRKSGQFALAMRQRDGVAAARRAKSAGCKYQCSGSSSQKMRCGSTRWENSM